MGDLDLQRVQGKNLSSPELCTCLEDSFKIAHAGMGGI